jgi:DNA-binding NarL/FixJ family response regulator
MIRAGLTQFLGSSPDIEVVAEASCGAELLKRLPVVKIDLLLLDLSMPGECGIELITHVKNIYPELRILILSGQDDIQLVRRALQAGASGYICKTCSPTDMLEAVLKIVATNKYLSPLMAEQIAYSAAGFVSTDVEMILSDRELEILPLIVQGKSVNEIASQLFITDKTVSSHKAHILHKLGLKNSVELVTYVAQRNLFS